MKTILLILILAMTYPVKRQVLIFYSSDGGAFKDKQVALLQRHQQERQERDMEVHLYRISDAKTEVRKWKVPPSAGFQFILVGKDGGEKLRTDTVVDAQQLFATIDSMHMRKQEMKHKN